MLLPYLTVLSNSCGEITLYHLPAATRTPINPVFSNYLFDYRDINYLAFPKTFKRKVTDILPTFRTETCTMFYDFIRGICHFQCFSFMPWLTSCFAIPFLSKTACTLWPVLILRGWQRAIVTVFSCIKAFKFLFKVIDFCFQQPILLCLHLNDELQFFNDCMIRCKCRLFIILTLL